MKKKILFVVFISILLHLVSGFSAGETTSPTQPVAKVGDIVISDAYLEEVLDRYIPPGGFHVSIEKEKRDKYKEKALKLIIEFELLYYAAKERGITVGDDFIEKVVKRNIKKFGSREKFIKILKRRYLSLKDFKFRVRRYNMAEQLLNQLSKEAIPSDKEIKEYYRKNKHSFKRPEAVHLYSILIKVPPNASDKEWEEKKRYAEQIRSKIKTPEDFKQMAYQYSEDEYRVKEGDLGYVHRGRLQPSELEDIAFNLKKGEISDVIKTIYGYHILMAGDKKPPEQLSLDEVKGRIKQLLYKRKFEELKNKIIQDMRKKYKVEVYIKLGNNKGTSKEKK